MLFFPGPNLAQGACQSGGSRGSEVHLLQTRVVLEVVQKNHVYRRLTANKI